MIREDLVILGGNLFGYTCDQNQVVAVLEAASDCGFTAIDTAAVYSGGESERLIGTWLRTASNRDTWRIATKVSYTGFSLTGGWANPRNVRQSLVSSLRRLHLDRIYMLQLHHPDPLVPIEATVEEVMRLKSEGLIERFGICNVSPDGVHKLQQEKLMHMIDGFQIYGNWLAPDFVQRIKTLVDGNPITVMVYGVLGRGVLSGNYLSRNALGLVDKQSRALMSSSVLKDATDPNLQAVLRDLDLRLRPREVSLFDFCVGYAWLCQVVPIIGFRTPAQVSQIKDTVVRKNNVLRVVTEIMNGYKGSEFYEHPSVAD